MKKTLITILIIILVISVSAFGYACQNEATVEEPAEEIAEKALDDEEVTQPQEAAEKEPMEETSDKEVIDEATEDEVEKMEYSIESNMGDLLDNPQTREILEKYIPDVVNSDRIDESRPYTLKLVLQFSGVEEDIIVQIDEDLRNVGSESDEDLLEKIILALDNAGITSDEERNGYIEKILELNSNQIKIDYIFNSTLEGYSLDEKIMLVEAFNEFGLDDTDVNEYIEIINDKINLIKFKSEQDRMDFIYDTLKSLI